MSLLPRPVRTLWRRLTSMRTALVLLFLLALASVPGSLLPQRPLNPTKVDSYLATHGSWGRLLDRIGAFDVFGSIWFSAVYLLLFASLIGCLIPRISVYARALRNKPIKAPRHLDRLAENGELTSELPASEVAARVTRTLRPRWRTIARTEDSGAIAVSAEKGYSREAGNLIFHVSLLVALVLIAGGKLLSYQGSIVTTEGTGFCNRPLSYDAFHSGRWVSPGAIAPLCIDNLNSFTATYRADGSPAEFKADVTYSEGLDGAPRHDVITVNHPLRREGARVYLINHGFSPTVTVTRPGRAPITDTEAFLPADTFYTSEGAFKFAGKDVTANNDIGLSAIFAPTPLISKGVVTSIAPTVSKPVLAVLAYQGLLNPEGAPQSVYTLDPTQIATGELKRVAAKNLSMGQSMALPDGTVVKFTGYKEWATLQVSHDPTQTALLVAAILMVTGLLGSLTVRRRRVWVRITEQPGARTLVSVGGLARNDSGNFPAEFETIVASVQSSLHPGAQPPVASTAEKIGAGRN
ncbi:cytochrome c biogenesis protein ResB [Jatrophihabitans lederbergiae]|uniref:Cytochrome c biogenesis protein ResB n=1 Tax=Jatrophihabitans lederbergiae TaxID=3075547 RepID=A0ABU2J9J0_9ACTN|nr:cytochrome c biogenesis protein ResB [Jatrophihabitans sp. DSM 44399]MDT0260948.1 cytochrome c biogenesis protein ResB [Jatrophihabitans sp. DSM 44399]